MRFEPRPPNQFQEFIRTYWEQCRAACPELAALSGKWEFEDLIPGLSDFDTRLVLSGEPSPAEWARISVAIGRVHLNLARRRPEWARILEHLPGINLTHREMLEPRCFYPEFRQWTFYQGDPPELREMETYLGGLPWSDADERFHLQRFATFYGPYHRGIDPAVNIGAWENKYPLHSRFLHYFTPAVQAAVSLALRRTVRGKLESLRLARQLFPDAATPELVLSAVERHFEVEPYYEEDRLRELEHRLEGYLRTVATRLAPSIQLIRWDPDDLPEALRAKIRDVAQAPAAAFFEVFKFCRLMKGRLLFYAAEVPWFETTWLIRNELSRIRRLFYEEAFARYARARFQLPLAAEDALARLEGELLTSAEARGVRAFADLASKPVEAGREKDRARAIAECFEPLHGSLEKMWHDIRTSECSVACQ